MGQLFKQNLPAEQIEKIYQIIKVNAS
jgi:hypothetical protein